MPNKPSPRRVAPIALAAAMLLAAIAGAATTTAIAQEDEGEDESFVDRVVGGNSTILDKAKAYGSGALTRALLATERLRSPQRSFGSDELAERHADSVQEYFNEHNASIITRMNDWGTGGTGHDVFELQFHVDNTIERRYLVADYNTSTGDYESAQIVESTDRDPDHCVRAEGSAASNARDELNNFHTEYIEPDEPPGTDYERYLAGAYAGNVHSTLLGGRC